MIAAQGLFEIGQSLWLDTTHGGLLAKGIAQLSEARKCRRWRE